MSIEKPIKLFIVEDDWEFSEELQKDLEASKNSVLDLPFEIKAFETGDECIKELHQNPELMVIDLRLPGMTGIELLKYVKNYNKDIKTIVLSGQKEVEQVLEVYKAGADDYLVKNDKYLDELEQAIIRLTSTIKLKRQVEELQDQIADRSRYSSILGNSTALLSVLKLIQKV